MNAQQHYEEAEHSHAVSWNEDCPEWRLHLLLDALVHAVLSTSPAANDSLVAMGETEALG